MAILDSVRSRIVNAFPDNSFVNLLLSFLCMYFVNWFLDRSGGAEGWSFLKAGFQAARRRLWFANCASVVFEATVTHNLSSGSQVPCCSKCANGILHWLRDREISCPTTTHLQEVPSDNVIGCSLYQPSRPTSNFGSKFIPKDLWVESERDGVWVHCCTTNSTNILAQGEKEHVTQITLTVYARCTTAIHVFVDACEVAYQRELDDVTNKKPHIFTFEGKSDTAELQFSEMPFVTNKSFANVFFAGKAAFVQRLECFLHHTEFYTRVGIPHTFGVMLHGPPGTGKTSVIKCIAKMTNRHIIRIALSRINSAQVLLRLFTDTKINDRYVPIDRRLYVFEEIDCAKIVLQRNDNDSDDKSIQTDVILCSKIVDALKTAKDVKKNGDIEVKSTITLGDFLELLDGIHEMPGRLIVMTTNRAHMVDDAILRPGRIDLQLEMGRASREDVRDMHAMWFGRKFTDDEFEALPHLVHTHAEVCNQLFSEYCNELV